MTERFLPTNQPAALQRATVEIALEQVPSAYLAQLRPALALQGEAEQRTLDRVKADLAEMVECYREEEPGLTGREGLARLVADFGPPDELGRKLHAVYRHPLTLKEIGLLALFPLALLPLLEANWGAFARQPEPTGITALGLSAILLSVGFYFAHRLRSPVQVVWGTALVCLLGSAGYAIFRRLLEPAELVALATAPVPVGKPQPVSPDQFERLKALLDWWGFVRFGFKLATLLLMIFLLLWQTRREWTLGALAVFTFLAIGPYQLFDTYISTGHPAGKLPEATVSYTGQFPHILSPMKVGTPPEAHLAIFAGGGFLFAVLVAMYLSLSLNPARYPAASRRDRPLPPRLRAFMNFVYGRPRLVRSALLLAALVLCLLYQQALNLIYGRIPIYPVALLAQVVLLAAFIFVPRSVVVTVEKRRSRRN